MAKPTRPDRAAAIVSLLLSQCGETGELASTIRPRCRVATPPTPKPDPERMARKSKVTPAILELLRASRGVSPADLVDQVKESFGVSLSQGTVYKVWSGHGKWAT